MPTDDKDHRHRHVNLRFLDPNPSTTGAQYHPPPPKPNPSSRILSLLLKFVVMAFIISLFLLFLGVAAVALLHIFVAGSILRRYRRRTSSAEDLQKFLPRFQYAAVLHETGRDCVVCLESFKEGEWCRSLPTCKHMFHENCVDNWLIKVPNCPICRTGVRLDSGASSSVMADDDYKLLWAVGI